MSAVLTDASEGRERAGNVGGPSPPRGRALRRRLIPPVVASLAVNIVLAAGDRLPAVDGLAYFEAGRNWLSGHGYTRFGAPELHFPPLVPVSLGLLERLTGSEVAALRSWNVCWGMAVMVALAGLAHQLWQDDDTTVTAAWLGGTIAGLGPMFFRRGAGSEAATLALLLAAVLLALPALEDRSGRGPARPLSRLAGSGLLVGLAYLARPEALLPGALIGVAVAVVGWRRSAGGARLRTTATLAGAFFFAVATLAIPYVGYLHGHTGSWSPTAKTQDVSIEAWRAVAHNDRLERDRILYALGPDGTDLAADTRPLAELAAEHPLTWLGIVRTNAATILRIYLAPLWGYGLAWTVIPAPLILVAAAELWRTRRARTTRVLVGMSLVSLATCLAFFTQTRYLALTTAVLTLFAARGLIRWARGLPRRWARTLLVAVSLLVAMSTLTESRSFLPERESADPLAQAEVGRWLSHNSSRDARVMTRSFYVQAYAGRPIVAMPASDYPSMLRFARAMGVTYVVADSQTLIDRRPQLYEPLMGGPAPVGLRLVVVLGQPSQPVRVYQLDPPAPPSAREPTPLGYVSD